MKVHFLRHAQSIFNANLTSEKDCNLTQKGIEQASELNATYDVVICSTMKRACQTLENSKIKYGILYFTDLCREKKVDICDFLPFEDETQKESDEELEKRIERFLYFLKSQCSSYQSILVVSHGDFIYNVGKKKQPYPMNAEIQIHDV